MHSTVCYGQSNYLLNSQRRHFDCSLLNFAQLACMVIFKIETKCAAVKVTPLTEVTLYATESFFFLNVQFEGLNPLPTSVFKRPSALTC